MSRKQKDIIVMALVIAVGLFFGINALSYQGASPWEAEGRDIGAAVLPLVYAACTVILAVIYLISCLRNKDAEYNKKEENAQRSHDERIDMLRAVGSAVMLAIYAWTFETIGFLINSIVYLFLQQLILTKKGERHWVRMAIISLVLPILCHVLFVNVLNYMLPSGVLGRWM